jgi:hypothetical protein
MLCRSLVIALVFAAAPIVRAQDAKTRPDTTRSGSSSMENHMMGPWKELNAFHRVMGATWHPASQKNDLAPLRARAKDLLSSAEAWAASTPPAMPASCRSEPVRSAVTRVVTETRALLGLMESGADDAGIKAALKTVHDSFEVAEKGCAGHGGHGQSG